MGNCLNSPAESMSTKQGEKAKDSGLEIFGYLAAWYIGNMVYSTYNKEAGSNCGKSDQSMAVATSQLLVGVVFSFVMWASTLRKLPNISVMDFLRLMPSGLFSAGAHAASVLSLTAGGVAFGQIVKATEPVFAAIVNFVVYNKKISLPAAVCLIPVIGGVAITVLKPPATGGYWPPNLAGGVNTVALFGGIIANICAAFKASESHKVMHDKEFTERLNGVENQFAVMTLASLIASIPLVFLYPMYLGKEPVSFFYEFLEYLKPKPALANSDIWAAIDQNKGIFAIFASGMAFYLYNEFATKSLKKLSPVTSSVANTAKRVFVIIAGILMYEQERKNATIYTAVGCTICMLGVGLYACIDELLKPKPVVSDSKKGN